MIEKPPYLTDDEIAEMNAPLKPLCLLPDELAQWTGRRQPKRQIQWLTDHGFRFFVGGDGLPKVDREYYREMVGVKPEKKKRGVRTEGLSGSSSHSNA